LNNKKSIGKAMQQLKLGDEDDTITLNEKVPLNVLCARSWQEGALTNIVEYSMGTKEERNRERQKYAAADKKYQETLVRSDC